jgi:hypothetical protein
MHEWMTRHLFLVFWAGFCLGKGIEMFKPEMTRWLERRWSWYRNL